MRINRKWRNYQVYGLRVYTKYANFEGRWVKLDDFKHTADNWYFSHFITIKTQNCRLSCCAESKLGTIGNISTSWSRLWTQIVQWDR
jgi:hypothetical protein